MKADIKKRALRRLKIIEGQVRGLQAMVEREEYCVHIINQSMAVREALSRVEDLILENHITTHVVAQMRGSKSDQAVREILTLHKLSKKLS